MEEAIKELLATKIKDKNSLLAAKRKIAKKFGIRIPLNSELIKAYKYANQDGNTKMSPLWPSLLKKRAIRTLSGIAPVAVLTTPFPCPAKCAYCPTEKNVPQSYLSNEPAVMRAIRCNYDPYAQVIYRLRALIANGHNPTKIELIVIGGTWSVLPEKYKYWFIKECFRAANDYGLRIKNYELRITNQINNSNIHNSLFMIRYSKKSLSVKLNNEQQKNEKARYKIIGITLETRPDYINEKELLQMRELGCTRVELGVQAIDDKILKLNRRGHDVARIAEATKLLKYFGFKVTYHIMPGLPGATPAQDIKMYRQLFIDARFQPDQIKFYPTVVTKGSLLYQWWKKGKYKPYTDKTLENIIINCKEATPPYVRIIRLIRDIPSESIVAGNTITNLRQIMQQRGVACGCIRCREARELRIKNYELRITSYQASGGEEYFISAESKDGKILYGFCRLRLAHNTQPIALKTAKNAALIRELHVYGELVPVGGDKKIQHSGMGKKLLKIAEAVAKDRGFEKMIVIAGVGVRGYYRKNKYRLIDFGYMIKKI